MSKLSGALKALIDAPFAHSGTVRAPSNITAIYEKISAQARSKQVEQPTWLAMATAATVTMNSPESLTSLHQVASPAKASDLSAAVRNAELMREVGLKCILLNGVPRTINCLGAFRGSLPEEVGKGLTIKASRVPTPSNINDSRKRGRALWDSVYRPHEVKLLDKLAHSHPDLPVHIISNYGLLFADPPREITPGQHVGRIATSILGIACLRAQSGVGPQVTSHIFGLRKALDDGSWNDGTQNEHGARWLASDEGGLWVLESIDSIVDAISHGQGSNYAPARSKL